jgi:hypothetical protein
MHFGPMRAHRDTKSGKYYTATPPNEEIFSVTNTQEKDRDVPPVAAPPHPHDLAALQPLCASHHMCPWEDRKLFWKWKM